MGQAVNLLIYYVVTIFMAIFTVLPFISPLGAAGCSTSLVQCNLPGADQYVKNYYGSAYVATTSEFQFGMAILIYGYLIFGWFLLPFALVAVRHLMKGT